MDTPGKGDDIVDTLWLLVVKPLTVEHIIILLLLNKLLFKYRKQGKHHLTKPLIQREGVSYYYNRKIYCTKKQTWPNNEPHYLLLALSKILRL